MGTRRQYAAQHPITALPGSGKTLAKTLASTPDGAASPLPGVRHRGPGFLGRLRLALLQKLDRMLVGRTHERHVAVARRPVDGDAALLQLLAGRIDVVDLVG